MNRREFLVGSGALLATGLPEVGQDHRIVQAALLGANGVHQQAMWLRWRGPLYFLPPRPLGELEKVAIKASYGWCWWDIKLFEVTERRWIKVSGLTWLG